MARYWFGGGIADWTLSTATVSTVPDVAQVTGGVTITFWSAETGGSQYTDLLDSDGAPVMSIMSSDGTGVRAVGQVPPFQGPDDVREMWASANGGPRSRMVALGHALPLDGGTMTGTLTLADGSPAASQAETRRYTDSVAGHNTDLRKWYAALANRHASVASVVVIGDSNSEGTGSTSIRRRWQQVLQAELRSRFQPAGITGAAVPYISASPRLTPVPSDYGLTVSGGVTQASYGLGLKAAVVAAGQSVTFTFSGTGAKLYGTKGGAVGKYGIVLDGAPEVVVDGLQGPTASGQMLWDSGALTAGTHTVVVSRAASTTLSPGLVYPEGLATFNGDESAGVRVVDGARHGVKISAFNQNTAWMVALGAVQGAGLLIMPWGANDATEGTSAATFRTDLDTIIANARAAGFAGSILLVEMPKRGNATEQVWTDYRAQIEAVAAADPDIATLDLRARMPDRGTAEAIALDLYADEVHYNDKGQGWIADQIATAVMPR